MRKDRNPIPLAEQTDSDLPLDHKAMPSLSVDWSVYKPFLEDQDISDDQKKELIETVWAVIVGCVNLGFEIQSPQQACEQNGDTGIFSPADMLSSLDSQNQLKTDHHDKAHLNSQPSIKEEL
jgi:hypothetical protein